MVWIVNVIDVPKLKAGRLDDETICPVSAEGGPIVFAFRHYPMIVHEL